MAFQIYALHYFFVQMWAGITLVKCTLFFKYGLVGERVIVCDGKAQPYGRLVIYIRKKKWTESLQQKCFQVFGDLEALRAKCTECNVG